MSIKNRNMRDPRLIAFERLLTIMDDLRAKCPWDKKQTFDTLRTLTIEETYELAEAISNNDLKAIEGEIGDLFLHLVFYCKLGNEVKAFTVESVLNAICEKLIFRHPHIYSNEKVENEEQVKANWEKLKLKEGRKSVLEGVPNSLPALVKATRIQEKVRGVGFDWDEKSQVWEKVQEELQELKEAEGLNNQDDIESEFGDVLFALINYARFIGVNPENALEKTNLKFKQRFTTMEEFITSDKKDITKMNLKQLDEYWNKAKLQERKK